jgi:hypothetical protein
LTYSVFRYTHIGRIPMSPLQRRQPSLSSAIRPSARAWILLSSESVISFSFSSASRPPECKSQANQLLTNVIKQKTIVNNNETYK